MNGALHRKWTPCSAALVVVLAATTIAHTAQARSKQQGHRAYEVEKILDTGPDENRVNIVILGDGYRESEQELLTTRARAFIDEFVGSSPFQEHNGWINAHVVHVISNESGADNGSAGGNRDTALGAYFNCGGTDRLLCVDDSLVSAVLAESIDYAQIVLVSVNDSKYGGAGGMYATFSAAAQATQIGLHEFAHSYSGLADEYEVAYPGWPACGADCPEPNASAHYMRDQIKWSAWIETSTNLPTNGNDNSLVGAYEGCRYQTTGVYRPIPQCKMRELAYDFCPVCSQALTLTIHSQVNAIESFAPSSTTLASDGCDPLDFAITRVESATAEVKWFLDGNEIAADKDAVSVTFDNTSADSHVVAVEVADLSPLVRRDDDGVMTVRQEWKIDVTPGECDQSSDASESTDTATNNDDTTNSSNGETDSDTDTDADTDSATETATNGDSSDDDDSQTMDDESSGTPTSDQDGTSLDDSDADADNDDVVTTCSCRSGGGWEPSIATLALVSFAFIRRRKP
jgi:hypothetical protein